MKVGLTRWSVLVLTILLVVATKRGAVERGMAFADQGAGGSGSFLVVLNSANQFADQLEPGVTISQVDGSGPLIGTKVEFACGTCVVASFDQAVPQIGGGYGICGYGGNLFGQILNNDDQLCARSTVSGLRYDVDMLSHRGSTGCIDADEGASCAAAGNRTSYLRNDGMVDTPTDTPTTRDTPTLTPTPTETATAVDTPTATATDTSVATPTNTPTLSDTQTATPTSTLPPACVGDCTDNGGVTIDELVRLVNIALGTAQVSECRAGDGNDDGQITIDELILAVSHALNGCPT